MSAIQFPRFSLSFAVLLLLSACGSGSAPSGDRDAVSPPSVGETVEYDWYMQSTTPAGDTRITKTGDGKIGNESFVHWNNRRWTVNSELQLDEEGRIVAQKISGISPFQAPIDEQFSYADGVASWSTPGESGSVRTDDLPFYLPNESIAFGAFGALIREALESIDNTLELLPSGSVTVSKIRDVTVEGPDGEVTLSMYALVGLGFTPDYVWLDENLNVAAFDISGYLGMLPKGWNPDVLKTISDIQSEEAGRYIESLAGDLAYPQSSALLLENVRLVDVVEGTVLEGRHVMTEGGRITAISEEPIAAAGATQIDAGGRYLIPGLWDMHGHFSLSDGVLNIAGGITNVRDIGSTHDKIMELTAKHDSGVVIGPNTYRAGFMDKAGPFASGWAAETLEDALERVDFYAENGYLQIKLYSSIEPEWVAPIAERAHGHGMRVSGHIPAFMSAEQAIRAGYDEIQHINMVFLNFLAGDREDTREQIRFTLYGDKAGELDLASDEVQAFFELLKDNDVVVDATAAIFQTQLVHKAGAPDPTFAPVIEHLPASIARGFYSPEMDMRGMDEAWAESERRQAEMLKALHEHGIQIVPGSDNLAAFTVHRELEVYAEAGIPNADVLRIATLDSARVVGADASKGSIAVGKDSDLVLLDGNPLEDISAVRKAALVMKGNVLYRPDELYQAVGVKPFTDSLPVR
ncbi:MAG: amidohydrolase family protein [Pseudomonadota bacterium]